MNRIQAKFAELKKRRETALIPFVTAGDPDLQTTLKILRALEAAGADAIELGVPFSDPTADGPTIQRSSERALRNGLSLPRIFDIVSQFRRSSKIPIILFGYFNPFFRYGLPKFCRDAARAGADGVLCVDLPPEESAELKRWTDAEGLDLIFLLSPTSGAERVKLVAQKGRGFIYYVSVTGVTGARHSLDDGLRSQVGRVRSATSLPIGVGFGISTPEQAARVSEFADAAVVGSALVETIERAKGRSNKARAAGIFVAGLKRAIKQASQRRERQTKLQGSARLT
ncbi:MAG TPA: tryptophan synthase subunit alpha [Candidatus Binatia bacterium]|nr:tryptophan synthase subunit alpha [Candidatus Binatia bacterium]